MCIATGLRLSSRFLIPNTTNLLVKLTVVFWLNTPANDPLINFSSLAASCLAPSSSIPINALYKSSISGGSLVWLSGSGVIPLALYAAITALSNIDSDSGSISPIITLKSLCRFKTLLFSAFSLSSSFLRRRLKSNGLIFDSSL